MSAWQEQALSAAFCESAVVNPIQTGSNHPRILARSGTSNVPNKERAMKKTVLALCVVPFLTMPAFAGSSVVVDKPMVVAQGADFRVGGVGIVVGERDRY